MELARREKYTRRGKTSKSVKEQFIIPFDLGSLNLFCSYVISSNKFIKRSDFINMRNLFSVIHEDSFKNDQEKIKRVNFIKRGLDARVLQNYNNPITIIKYINGGPINEDLVDPNNFTDLSLEEVSWVRETVSACMKNSFMNDYVDTMLDVCTRYKTTDYRNRSAIIREFENIIAEIQNKFRKVRIEDETEATFSLRNGVFENSIIDIHERLSSPSNKLLTGMQGFNEMLSGGFQSKRVYLLFALPGEGKTTTLLNLAYQLKKNNKDYKTKDPTKRPCIVFLTMENSVEESVTTLFNISTTTEDITNFTPDEAIRMLKEEGELFLTDESPIDIIIKYKPVNSVDTSYLYTLVEDLEDEGYETICVIQDYIKRIRPVDYTKDLRIDLGNVVNDFKSFATIKDIPVISASQLNREAAKHIDEGRKSNKADLIRLFGRANIGESMLILENIDGGFMVAPEWDANGVKYMGIQRIKARYKTYSTRGHMYQPYAKGNPIKLVEDQDFSSPMFRDSLRGNKDEIAARFSNAQVSSYMGNNIKSVDDNIKLLHCDDTNIYMNANSKFSELADVAYTMPPMRPLISKFETQELRPLIRKVG